LRHRGCVRVTPLLIRIGPCVRGCEVLLAPSRVRAGDATTHTHRPLRPWLRGIACAIVGACGRHHYSYASALASVAARYCLRHRGRARATPLLIRIGPYVRGCEVLLAPSRVRAGDATIHTHRPVRSWLRGIACAIVGACGRHQYSYASALASVAARYCLRHRARGGSIRIRGS
jgi:hypothetical protein